MFVSGGTTEAEANILKGILSQLQLNTVAVNLVKNRKSNLPKHDSVSARYSVMEVSKTRLKTNNYVSTPLRLVEQESSNVLLLISYTLYVVYIWHRLLLLYLSDQ
jgi:hypothetical protein